MKKTLILVMLFTLLLYSCGKEKKQKEFSVTHGVTIYDIDYNPKTDTVTLYVDSIYPVYKIVTEYGVKKIKDLWGDTPVGVSVGGLYLVNREISEQDSCMKLKFRLPNQIEHEYKLTQKCNAPIFYFLYVNPENTHDYLGFHPNISDQVRNKFKQFISDKNERNR